MQTSFDPELLERPAFASSEKVIRKCVHCGFCTATCPTFVLLGEENDSPRGRIYLMKDMLENDRPADAETVKHIDRCLSCLACMTTCPSGVNYMHLVDHARAHIAKTYKRPLMDRLTRTMLGLVLALSRALPAGAAGRAAGQAVRAAAAEAVWRHAENGAAVAAGGWHQRSARRASGCRHENTARRTTRRLRTAGARSGDQRGDDPPAHPPRRRGRGGEGGGLLRRAAAPHGPGGRLARDGGGQRPRLHGREARTRARPHRHQHIGLRHDAEGLRVHAARSSRPRRRRGGSVGAVARRQRDPGGAADRARPQTCRSCASPTIPPARCSTASG